MIQLPHTKSYVKISEIDVLDLARHTLVFSNGHAWSLYARDEGYLATRLMDDKAGVAMPDSGVIINPKAIVAASGDYSKLWLRSGRRVDVAEDDRQYVPVVIEQRG